MENQTIEYFKYTGYIFDEMVSDFKSVYLIELPKSSTDLLEVWQIAGKNKMSNIWVWATTVDHITLNTHYKSI